MTDKANTGNFRKAEKKHKVGIMGGTFDPIHMGHLMLAQSAYEELGLEKVVFMVAGNPPHKSSRSDVADVSHRVKMTEMAIEDDIRFEMNLIETYSKKTSYTYETLQKLTESNPENEYYFIIGEDSLVDFSKWKNPEIISKLCKIAVGHRPGSSFEDISKILEIRNNEYNDCFVLVRTPGIDISSSVVRDRLDNGLSVRYYIPDKVFEYINAHNLYNAASE